MKILSVMGTRPNFMKVAPLHRTFANRPGIQSTLVHTGQHYDSLLNDVFVQQLELPLPDYRLRTPSGTIPQQTAAIMRQFERIVRRERPDWVLVVGDVTSTLACALTAAQVGVRVAHVEAGLRSGDRTMPEEINRILVDSLADLLFVSEASGLDNLLREGVAAHKIHFVGNVMIDSLVRYRAAAHALNTVGKLGVPPKSYVLLTMHRPSNVDTEAGLQRLIQLLAAVARQRTVLFPIHPRTRASLEKTGYMHQLTALPNVHLLAPQGYLEFLNLLEQAALVITDSGGIQEEATYLEVPCLTFRTTTERPITVTLGTNQLLADLNPAVVQQKVGEILAGQVKTGQLPPLWDGQAATRIADIFSQLTA